MSGLPLYKSDAHRKSQPQIGLATVHTKQDYNQVYRELTIDRERERAGS